MKVKLNTPFQPSVGIGETEQHYGVPFTATDSGSTNEKTGLPVLILVADIDEEEAEVMIAIKRVEAYAEPAAEPEAGKKKGTADKDKA